MRYPEFLSEGGTIGFVAPSFGCATEPYKTAFGMTIKRFEKEGYTVELGPNCYEDNGIGISNTPQECGKELTQMYESNVNDVLISCGGGELMCEILPYVDFDRIKAAKPKWYLGYSDNTNFTFLRTILNDTASIYGVCAGAFGMKPWHKAIDDTFRLITGKKLRFTGYDKWEKESLKSEENPCATMNVTEKRITPAFIGSKRIACEDTDITFSGRLIGGCMDCLVNILGTKYDKVADFNERYKEDGFIWFLESCDLNVFAIRRAMWQMENAGWFKYLKGFVIGRPLVFGQEMMGLDQYRAVTGIAAKYNVPVIMDCDFGHLSPSMPIVSGAYTQVKVKDNDLSLNYRFC